MTDQPITVKSFEAEIHNYRESLCIPDFSNFGGPYFVAGKHPLSIRMRITQPPSDKTGKARVVERVILYRLILDYWLNYSEKDPKKMQIRIVTTLGTFYIEGYNLGNLWEALALETLIFVQRNDKAIPQEGLPHITRLEWPEIREIK